MASTNYIKNIAIVGVSHPSSATSAKRDCILT